VNTFLYVIRSFVVNSLSGELEDERTKHQNTNKSLSDTKSKSFVI